MHFEGAVGTWQNYVSMLTIRLPVKGWIRIKCRCGPSDEEAAFLL